MVIAREYVTFKHLVDQKDPGGKLFMELLQKTYPEERWDEAYNMLKNLCLYQREMEWGFHNIRELIEGFKKIDAENPYDNGYAYEDVWAAEVLDNDGDNITLLLTTARTKNRKIVAVKQIKL